MSQKKGCWQLYQQLNKQVENCVLRKKWCSILIIDINEKDWEQIYKICFKTMQINDLVWFQYRIIHRIVGTHSYMRKLKISATSSSRFCNVSKETLIHLFTSCPAVLEFWNNLKKWLQQQFNLHTIIFGVLEKDIDFFSRNCVILITKKIIFDRARNAKILKVTYHTF